MMHLSLNMCLDSQLIVMIHKFLKICLKSPMIDVLSYIFTWLLIRYLIHILLIYYQFTKLVGRKAYLFDTGKWNSGLAIDYLWRVKKKHSASFHQSLSIIFSYFLPRSKLWIYATIVLENFSNTACHIFLMELAKVHRCLPELMIWIYGACLTDNKLFSSSSL